MLSRREEPEMPVRCKMNLALVKTEAWNPEGLKETKGFTLTFRPVCDGSEENKAFFASTPSGELTLQTVNADAAKLLIEHRSKYGGFGEFYVDITPA